MALCPVMALSWGMFAVQKRKRWTRAGADFGHWNGKGKLTIKNSGTKESSLWRRKESRVQDGRGGVMAQHRPR